MPEDFKNKHIKTIIPNKHDPSFQIRGLKRFLDPYWLSGKRTLTQQATSTPNSRVFGSHWAREKKACVQELPMSYAAY